MKCLKRKSFGIVVVALLSVSLGGCFLFDSDKFADWPEYRMERDGKDNGEMVAKVRRRGDKEKWPGDSYEVLVRWPTNIKYLQRELYEHERKKEAQAFLRKLCGEDRKIYVIDESFNDRTGEAYFKLWCQPPKQS